MKQNAPYHNGQRNDNWAPSHLKFQAVIGDTKKFDSMYNIHESTDLNHGKSKENHTFMKLNPNELSKSAQKESGGHNWWANKHDEFLQGEINDAKKQKNKKSEKVFFGKKKFDFEESVSNNRTYMEEFNVRKIIFLKNIFLDENEKIRK